MCELFKSVIKYGVTVSVRVRVMARAGINIKLVLHFIHFIDLYSVGGANGCRERIHDEMLRFKVSPYVFILCYHASGVCDNLLFYVNIRKLAK